MTEGGLAGPGQIPITRYAEMQGTSPSFPYVLGSEKGRERSRPSVTGVTSRAVGERVFAASFLNPTGGFYAEYVCVDADSSRRFRSALALRRRP